ncbi:unnamed protein product [Camellia sinensis]
MWAALRSRALLLSSSSYSIYPVIHQWKLGFNNFNRTLCSSLVAESDTKKGLLNLEEVQKVLTNVKVDNVKVVPIRNHCDWTDFMVFVTGRSSWHVRNIAQALFFSSLDEQVKQKQRGAQRTLLPSVEGEMVNHDHSVPDSSPEVHLRSVFVPLLSSSTVCFNM